MAFFHIAKAYL